MAEEGEEAAGSVEEAGGWAEAEDLEVQEDSGASVEVGWAEVGWAAVVVEAVAGMEPDPLIQKLLRSGSK